MPKKTVKIMGRKGWRRTMRRVRRVSSISAISKMPHLFAQAYRQLIDVNPSTMGALTSQFANAGALGATGSFTLDLLPGVAEITAMFDEYRIKYVKTTFTYSVNSNGFGDASTLPILYVVTDNNDGVPLTSLNAMLEYGSLIKKRLDKPVTIYRKVYPGTDSESSTALIFGGGITKHLWINTDNDDLPHFGFKWGISTPGVAANNVYGFLDVTHTIVFECRNKN